MRDSTIIKQLEKIENDSVFLHQSSLITSVTIQAIENLLCKRFSVPCAIFLSAFRPRMIRVYIRKEMQRMKEEMDK